MNWPTAPGTNPSGPASGEAATKNAQTAMIAISTRRRANRCIQPTGLTVHSASSMPAANQEKNAGGQFRMLVPYGD